MFWAGDDKISQKNNEAPKLNILQPIEFVAKPTYNRFGNLDFQKKS